MLLSVALLAVGALFYYAFFYNDEDSWWTYFKWSTGEQFWDRDDLIVRWTKWEWEVKYLGSACRWLCRCFCFYFGYRKGLFRPFGPKVVAFPLCVIKRIFLSQCLSNVVVFFSAHFLELLTFLLQTYRMCLFVICTSWSDPTEVCLTFLKVLLMPNWQVQKGDLPHNPTQWIKEKVLHHVVGFCSLTHSIHQKL